MFRIISKPGLMIFAMLVAIMPWLTGGKDLLAMTVTFFVLMVAVFLAWRLRETRAVGFTLFSVPAILLGGWAAASMVWSVNHYQTLIWLLPWLMAAAIFALAVQLRNSERLVAVWVNAYLGLAALVSIYGMYLYLVGEYDRLTSSFYWANPAAAYLMPAIIIGWWYFATTNHRWYLLQSTVVLAGYFLTSSRASFLVLILILLATIAVVRRGMSFWLRAGTVLGLGLGLALVLSLARQQLFHHSLINQQSRFAEAASGESTSSSDRLYYLESTANILRAHPVVGTGAGTFASVYPQYQKRVISAVTNAHNFYAQTASELGLVGGVLLALAMIGLIVGVVRGVRQDRRLIPLAVGLAALVLHAGLDIDASYPALVLLAATLAGLCIAAREPKERPSFAIAVVFAVMLVMTLPMVSAYQSRVLALRGEYAQDDENYAQAADYYRQSHLGIVYNPDSITAEGINYYVQAVLDIDKDKNLRLARERAEAAESLDPNDSQHAFLLARVNRLDNQLPQAEAAYRQAIRLDPLNHPEYYEDLAELYLIMPRPADAKAVATKAIELYPSAVIANRNADDTIKPTVAKLYVARGSAEVLLGDRGGAAGDVAAAMVLDPSNHDAVLLKLNNGL